MGSVSSHQTQKRVEIRRNEILSGNSSQYLVEKVLGEGCFRKVALCSKVDTKEKMAVKILGNDDSGTIELFMLQELRKLDPGKNHLVTFTEHFLYRGYVCLVFEMLDVTLYDYMKEMKFTPMHLFEIQIIAQQLLVALNALRSIGVVHADIKPDNIMFNKRRHQSVMVKLIDFGMARPLWLLQSSRGKVIQPIPFRAPEVILGLKLNEAVDMWSLGCVLAFMCLGQRLYPGCEYKIIKDIVETQGQLDDHLLDSGIYTKSFFRKDEDSPSPSWKLNTHDEYADAAKITPHSCTDASKSNHILEDMLEFSPDLMGNIMEHEDTMAFLCLLKQMLNVDPEERIHVSAALENHFIKKTHWNDIKPTLYMSPDCLKNLLGQLDESTGKFKPWVGENKDAGSNDEPSATDGDSNDRPDSLDPSQSFPTTGDVGIWMNDLLPADGGANEESLSCQLKDSSVSSMSFPITRDVGTWTDDLLSVDENNTAGTNDELSATAGLNEAGTSFSAFRSRSAADDNDRPQEEMDLDDTITAETDVQPPDTNKTASAVSVPQNAGTTGLAQVKTKTKYMKRICKFFTGHQGNNSSPQKTGSHCITAAGPEEKPLDLYKADLSVSSTHNSNTGTNAGNVGLVEVKTKKTYLKRIRKFFSRIFKPVSCCTKDVTEQKHSTLD